MPRRWVGLVLLVMACGDPPTPPPDVVPDGVVVRSGDQQVQVPGVPLFAPIVVQLETNDGLPAPVSGVALTWNVVVGTGSVLVDVDTTTAQGFATGLWFLGDELGNQEVEVTSSGLRGATVVATARFPGPIVFVSGRQGLIGNEFEGYPGDLFAMEPDGSNVMPLFSPAVGIQYLADPQWAPDGASVLFTRFTGRPAGGVPGLLHAGVHRLDVTTLIGIQVPESGFPAYVDFYIEASSSPDGMAIMAHLDTAIGTQNIPPDIAPGQLHVMSAEGLGEDPVLPGVDLASSPDWSPAGDRIAFVCVTPGGQNLCLMDSDGQNLVTLTSADSADTDPRWSPAGDVIAFVRDRQNGGGLWTIGADGSGITQLLAGNISSPAWSPTGDRLLFTWETPTTQDIYVIDLNSGDTTNLTRSPFRDRDPTWRR